MAKSLEAHDKLLIDIFSDEYQFEIPDYQRPYSWTTDQAGELLSDLLAAMNDFAETGNKDAFYFLGSIVLIKADRNPISQVVDGQQRLSTLTILFAALRVLIPDRANEITSFLYKQARIIKDNTPNSYRLRAIEEDVKFFEENIQDAGGIERLAASNEKLTDSRKNMRDNAVHLLKELSKLDIKQRENLFLFIAERCSMVVISTPNFESAYRIFSVLNNRGLDLYPTDILKAEILGKIRKKFNETKSTEYAKKWTKIERGLTRNGFVDLLGHIRMLYAKQKQSTILSKEFSEFVGSKYEAEDLIDKVIIPYAEIYGYLKHQNFAATAGAEEVNEQASHLDAVDWKDWVAPALLYFNKFKAQPTLVADFLKRLERISYYLLITKAGFNTRIEAFKAIISDIEKDDFDGDCSNLASLQLDENQKRDFRNALNGDIYRRLPRARTALILRLENLMTDKSVKVQYRNYSIEHVLPQTPAEDSIWLTNFPDPDHRDEWTQKLANLVPLHSKKNPAASNYDFETKKNVYFAGRDDTISPFVLTQDVRNVAEWTPEVLKDRQEKLLGRLYKHWELN
ncbi:DUF262 domain-containing protein [Brucella gallinifaecis]|uniref:DUF262 domain-containing protein n=1 Tax=Brucella gallinifaecis TaxID=215590 RepID=UPI002362575A|nr:DUF262 domain-containing HNH endonuclease family protein [Brucella gallinifaecis]